MFEGLGENTRARGFHSVDHLIKVLRPVAAHILNLQVQEAGVDAQ